MIRKSKKRVGFTLVEMVLSIAIILMIGGVIAGVCVSISNSFVTTYNVDDSADYAMLYARGFENSFLKYTQVDGVGNTGKNCSWYVKPNAAGIPYLYRKDSGNNEIPVFEPNFMTTGSSSSPKWVVCMFFNLDDTNKVVNYRIFIKDNYSDTNFMYRYDGSFWVPRFEDRAKAANVAGTRSIDTTTGSKLDATTLAGYGFTSGTYPSNWLDNGDNYTDVIVYNWGGTAPSST
jgi:type II secretory pathway pseudopilin PulG